MYTNFVTLSEDDIPNNFIEFNSLDITINHQQMNPDKPLYFTIDTTETSHNHTFSDVCIDQEDDDGVMNHIARFYNRYGYTKALRLLLNDESNLDYYRLMITGINNPENNKVNIVMTLYVEKMFLLNLYEKVEIPPIIYKMVIDNMTSKSNVWHSRKKNKKPILKDGTVKLDQAQPFPVNGNIEMFKRSPYNYQQQNYCWMTELERRVDTNTLSYQTYETSNNTNIGSYYIEAINEHLFLDRQEKRMVDISTFPTKTFNFKGGVLADDVGLGKTFSTISLIKRRHESGQNPTLIICPRRLCLQWKNEIDLSTDLSTYIVNSITQFKKLNLENINTKDIILVSYQFLTSKKYTELVELNNADINYPLFHIYQWNRLILDEGHEYITSNMNINKMHYRDTLKQLYLINSKYRWICSGTPYTCGLDIFEILRFLGPRPLTNIVDYSTRDGIISDNTETKKMFNHIQSDVVKLLFRKNTKDTVSNEVQIPLPNIQTTLLNMTNIERAIYNTALDDKDKKIQLCNNIQVCESHVKVLGNEPISQTEAHDKMVTYYETKMKYQEIRLENIQNDIDNHNRLIVEEDIPTNQDTLETLQEKYNEVNNEFKDNTRKCQIFSELAENLEKEKNCPVCYEELETLYKAVTPCGHFICGECIQEISKCNHKLECPMCRNPLKKESLNIISPENMDMTMKLGTKMSELITYSNQILADSIDNRVLVFSQWDSMLRLISKNLTSNSVNHMILNGSYHTINSKLRKFRLDNSIRIILMSSEKAASGLNLTEANHIILMDTLNNDPETSKVIESQAIGRAVRIGQTQHVQVKRFIMANTIEEDLYNEYLKI